MISLGLGFLAKTIRGDSKADIDNPIRPSHRFKCYMAPSRLFAHMDQGPRLIKQMHVLKLWYGRRGSNPAKGWWVLPVVWSCGWERMAAESKDTVQFSKLTQFAGIGHALICHSFPSTHCQSTAQTLFFSAQTFFQPKPFFTSQLIVKRRSSSRLASIPVILYHTDPCC